MREIKFRVWSQEDKEYRTDCRLADLFTCETGTPATVYSEEGNRFDIEQYTELKDRNGKEIYEGDIVEYGNKNIEAVRFEQGGFYPFAEGYNDFGCPYGEDVKVIGNIHENPELLGGEECQ